MLSLSLIFDFNKWQCPFLDGKDDKDNDENRIVYDDEAVAKLLDRTQEGQVEKEHEMNDYFKSFKVRALLSRHTPPTTPHAVMMTYFLSVTSRLVEWLQETHTLWVQ